MAAETSMKTYRFGPFTLDPGQGILSAGDQEIALAGKAFDTLAFLVENAGRVVSKRALIDRVWPDSHVEENNLAQHISLVRKTLAAIDPKTEYVQTMARRGYRFAVAAETGTPEPAPLPETRYAQSGDISIAYQVVLCGVIIFLAYSAVRNAATNLEKAHISSGFGFWNQTAGFDISQTLIEYSAQAPISSSGRDAPSRKLNAEAA